MKKLIYISFLLAGCLCAAAQERFISGQPFHSEMLGKDLPYAVVLPEEYENRPDKSYPVIYLTHGLGCTPDDWNDRYIRFEATLKQLEADGLGNFIYIFPTGFNSYYSNTYDGSFPYMDMFIKEFVPFIDSTYRTIADRQHRATVGFSMGGFGAMVLPLKNTDVFSISVPLSMSLRTDGQYLAEPLEWWDGQWGFIFGGVGQEGEARLTDYYKAHNPFYQFTAENHEELSKVKWFLHCGDDEEQLLIANDDLHVQMRENGYEHEYRVGDGGHTGTYWRSCLQEVLPYIESVMKGEGGCTEVKAFPETPKKVKRNTDGGTVIFLAYEGLRRGIVKDIIRIVKRDAGERPLAVVPCNTRWFSLERKMKRWAGRHSFTDTQVIALGKAGRDAYSLRDRFSRLYFDNADLLDDETALTAEPDRFWFVSQTDDGPYYKDMGGLYKACKKSGAEFEYRVRNGFPDKRTNILTGIETIKPYIIY